MFKTIPLHQDRSELVLTEETWKVARTELSVEEVEEILEGYVKANSQNLGELLSIRNDGEGGKILVFMKV